MLELPPEPPLTARILVVDDRPANRLALEGVLESLGQPVVSAASGEEALACLREQDFAVVLLDVMMPELDGLRTADRIRAQDNGRGVPIIFLTAGDTPSLEGYAHGAADFLRKPFDPDVVRAKVAVFLELFRAREQVRAQAVRLAAQERAAEARNAALLNASLDAIIGMDHLGRITEFNSAAVAMFGRRRQDVLGRPMADLLIPERLREPHRRGLARYLATGEKRVLDTRIEVAAMRADGAEFPIELAICRVATAGAPAFVGYVRDLTARRVAERERTFLAEASEALASSLDYEATLQTLVRLAVPRVSDWCAVDILGDDPRTSVRLAVAHVDPAKVALAGELRERYPPDPEAPYGVPHVLRTCRSELLAEVPDALLEGAARDAEHLRILRELGLRSAMIVPIAARGRTLGAITFVAAESGRRYGPADVTMAEDLARRAAIAVENARLYQATQAAEARNRFLAEATEALASSLDYATTLERVARLAVPTVADSAALYQLEADGAIRLTALADRDVVREALGRELDALLPLRSDQQDRLLPRVVRTGRAELVADIPETLRQVWSPSSRAAQIVQDLAIRSYMAVPLVVRGRVLGAIALTTATSGRRLGADDLALAQELARRAGFAIENAQLYREAQNANRLKDEFLATVSHELRTPLTAILGWTHVLRRGRPGQAPRALETIERNAHAQARIIDDVLDVSRIMSGKLRLELERVNLADVLRGALDSVRPAAEAKQIELVVSVDSAAGAIAGDPARLQQVCWNLLSNAIKFTPNGGRVEVRLEQRGSDVCLRVSDTGHGIHADFLPHVFERFRQADSTSTRAHGGLGLGLAIVRDLVELHGGRVGAESGGENLGATFTVTLPIRIQATDEPSRSPSPPASRSDAMPRVLEGVRVLVVDDEADARDFIALLLEEHGAEVTTAQSAHAAVEMLDHATPDVLVSDIAMTGADGYALIGQIRALGVERGFWFPAVALTAYARAHDRNRALSAGYQVHLSKPIVPDTLVATVAQLVQRTPAPG